MKLVDVHMKGNEHGQLRRDTVYARLLNDDGSVAIMATLEYILGVIRDKDLEVEGVTVEREPARGVECSYIRLTKYD